MEATLNKYVITNSEVEEKLADKREYIKLNPSESIP